MKNTDCPSQRRKQGMKGFVNLGRGRMKCTVSSWDPRSHRATVHTSFASPTKYTNILNCSPGQFLSLHWFFQEDSWYKYYFQNGIYKNLILYKFKYIALPYFETLGLCSSSSQVLELQVCVLARLTYTPPILNTRSHKVGPGPELTMQLRTAVSFFLSAFPTLALELQVYTTIPAETYLRTIVLA